MADDREHAFEQRMAALKRKMESGLVERARRLREMAERVEGGDPSAREELKREGHRLRGVAGSYGHDELGTKAAELERSASVSPPATLGAMARGLAALAEQASAVGAPPEDVSHAPPPRAAGTTAHERPIADDDALRVLAIDDDPFTQRLLHLTLDEVGGFAATIVSSAAEALALLRSRPYDIVVSDAMMPDMNGRDFCDAARAAGAHMPIVILSAASADELGWAPQVGGPVAWMRKPFRPTTIVQEIARIARAHRGD